MNDANAHERWSAEIALNYQDRSSRWSRCSQSVPDDPDRVHGDLGDQARTSTVADLVGECKSLDLGLVIEKGEPFLCVNGLKNARS